MLVVSSFKAEIDNVVLAVSTLTRGVQVVLAVINKDIVVLAQLNSLIQLMVLLIHSIVSCNRSRLIYLNWV
jgi:hypothetical protein